MPVDSKIMGASNHMMLLSYSTHFRKIYKFAALWAEVFGSLHFRHQMVACSRNVYYPYWNSSPYREEKIGRCHVWIGSQKRQEFLR